jgi:regulatory protein
MGSAAMPPRDHRPRGRKVTAAVLENVALHYLERFAGSTASVRRVLMRRVRRSAEQHGTDPAEGAALVEALLARLTASGVLDDRRYAASKAASLQRRGTSRRGVAGRLAQQGIDRETVAEALAGVADEVGDADLAAACALARRRRLGPYRAPEARDAAQRKDLATFARAGFSHDIARRVLACEGPEEVEALGREE